MADETDDAIFSRMLTIFEGVDQQGPGDDASTAKALGMVPSLGPESRVLDVGCGSGRTTMVLARETQARIDAVDLLPALVESLAAKVAEASLGERVVPRVGDMTALPFEPDSFDLIWSEGAIYQMGFAEGLRAWRPLLKAGGHIVVTHVTWLVENPPPACRAFWDREYPAITTIDANLELATEAGYRVVDHFTLPRRSWLDGFYTPVTANLDRLERAGFDDDPLLGELVAAMREEAALFDEHGDTFGYEFFVLAS